MHRKILTLLSLLLLCACSLSAPAEPLPLQPYTDPRGVYQLSLPEGWQVSQADQVLTFRPGLAAKGEGDLYVSLLVAPLPTDDPEALQTQSSQRFEAFLSQHITEEYEVYSRGETKLAGQSALLIDYARPYAETFLTGRLVMAVLPGYAVAFFGHAERTAWEAFLPTFRQMLADFQLLTTPLSGTN